MFNGTMPLYLRRIAPDNIRTTETLTSDTADGPIGGTAQKIGGPLDKEGSIGQHFNADGKIGGMVQENLANKK